MKMKNLYNLKYGFSLVEIMIVVICMALLMGPIFFILHSNTQNSLTGMLRIDTTMEARRIIKQVHSDLKLSCFDIPYGSTYTFADNLGISNYIPNVYVMMTFPVHKKLDNIFSSRSSGKSIRNIAIVNYHLEPHKDSKKPSYNLIREVNFKGKVTKRILSKRVNYFEIKPIEIQPPVGKEQYYYLVTLQLVDALNERDFKDKGITKNNKVKKLKNKIILADFFDVVYPEFFHSMWNHIRLNPNWHTPLKNP